MDELPGQRFELTRFGWIKKLVRNRWLQFVVSVFMLAGFVFAILTGFLGTEVGSRNFGIIFVWIVWWAAVITLLVPFTGRLWCSVCPLPLPGEWIQRRALIKSGRKIYTLGLRWPRALKNIWLQNGVFLGIAIFSAAVLTHTKITAAVMAGYGFLAVILSVFYEKRIFCRYVCPVGGFIGLYSLTAPFELRVKNATVCQNHKSKDCCVGNDNGYGCPWMLYPGTLDRNAYCGMCGECMRTCPLDNIVINIRKPGSDLIPGNGKRRMDEAYKAFIMLGSALLYSAVFLGPWAGLKEAAYRIFTPQWFGYAISFLTATLFVIPGLFLASVASGWRLGGSGEVSLQKSFIDYAYVLVPLGLAAWIGFSFSFVFINFSYVWPLISDPFGWGWNLFGTAGMAWTPYLSRLTPFLQAPVLLIGLIAAINLAFKISKYHSSRWQAAAPVVFFCASAVAGFMWLYLG